MVANDIDVYTLGRTLLVSLLVVTAGCSALGGSPDASTPSGTSTSTPTPTQTDATATATTTTTATGTGTDDTRGSDNETATDDGLGPDNETDGPTATVPDNATSGQVAVVVDGRRLPLQQLAGRQNETFWIDANRSDVWHSTAVNGSGGSVTLAAALSTAGVDASASRLSDGTTYEEDAEGTKLVYRVDGESVDPTEYTLEPDDEVWVLALTDETNVSTPGEYIPPDRLHVHGSIEMTVDGESLNFSRERYQAAAHNSHFHFEGGHADPWHAHSWSVTLAYALSTLEGVEVTDEALTYDNTTYEYDDPDTTVRFTVDGEEVAPTDYLLKDGDSVRVVVESEE
jgi:hypothetical protein